MSGAGCCKNATPAGLGEEKAIAILSFSFIELSGFKRWGNEVKIT
jgi:hypothetical protein